MKHPLLKTVVSRLYIVLLCAVPLAHMAEKIMTESGGIVSRYLPLLVIVLAVFGMVSHQHNQPRLHRIFWLVFFWLLAASAVSAAVYGFILLLWQGSTAQPGASVLLGFAFLLMPLLVSLYRYSRASNRIWHNTSEDIIKSPVV